MASVDTRLSIVKTASAMALRFCMAQLPIFHFWKGYRGKGCHKRYRCPCVPGHYDGCPAIADSQKEWFSVRIEPSEKQEAAAWLWNIRKKN
jgi:hypothetical protein